MKKLVQKIIGFGAPTMVALYAMPASAQDLLRDIGREAGYAEGTDLITILGSLIQVILSVLGVILLVLVIYAGFLWMTAGGDPGKVDKAKGLIINAIIGLVLILSALAISQFVFNALIGATDVMLDPNVITAP